MSVVRALWSDRFRVTGRRVSLLSRLLAAIVIAYRWTAVMRTPRCRFAPSCSTYALEALRMHGAWRGSTLAMRRLGRCHPWNDGGFDPVPLCKEQR